MDESTLGRCLDTLTKNSLISSATTFKVYVKIISSCSHLLYYMFVKVFNICPSHWLLLLQIYFGCPDSCNKTASNKVTSASFIVLLLQMRRYDILPSRDHCRRRGAISVLVVYDTGTTRLVEMSIYTLWHGRESMHATRSSHEKAVCLSVCLSLRPSVKRVICDRTKESCAPILYHMKEHLS